MTRVPLSADDTLLRSAARRMALQVTGASAAVVLLAICAALWLGPLLHRFRESGREEPRGDGDGPILLTTLVVAGVVGVMIAGIVGFLVARRAVAPLGRALALQRRFVADASHELRTPLTVLQTRAQLLARRMSPGDPARPTVEELVADTRVLGEIVAELLASAQLSADPQQGELVELTALTGDVVRAMGQLADRAGITLTTHPAGTVTVIGSRTALRRAVTALVDNALGHTPAGGTVQVDAVLVDGRARITVTDDGEGLGSADPADLTGRFARGTRAVEGPGGRRFGLGLALVDEVARSHRGTLQLSPGATGGVRAALDFPAAAHEPERRPS